MFEWNKEVSSIFGETHYHRIIAILNKFFCYDDEYINLDSQFRSFINKVPI